MYNDIFNLPLKIMNAGFIPLYYIILYYIIILHCIPLYYTI
jgi:hypothetical protein